MKRMQKIISLLLMLCLALSVIPMQSHAAGTPEVTRAQWVQALVETFVMYVEEDNYPDNYFSDLTGEEAYYRDILLAVEFGAVDLEAGMPFRPDDAATREFAAQTLNFCLGFQLEESVYTFAESSTVAYPDDIQVAINRGWFALSGAKFLPEQPVTAAEMNAMLDDAETILLETEIDSEYDSSVDVQDSVICVPAGTNVQIPAENIVEITDCPVAIQEGNLFLMFYGDLPLVYKALDVEVADNVTLISCTTDGTDDALEDYDYEGTVEADLENFEGSEATAFTVGDQTVYMGATTFGIDYNNSTKVLTATKTASLGDGIDATISVKISNLKFDLVAKKLEGRYSCIMTGDTTLTTNVSVDMMDVLGKAKTVELGRVYIGGVGYVKLSVEFSLSGEMSLVWTGDMTAGFTYNHGEGFRVVKSFRRKSFTFMAEVTLKSGLRLDAGVDVLVFDANVWAKIGAQMDVKGTAYDSGSPSKCLDMDGFMYASVGVEGSIIKIFEFGESYDIYTRSNSPIRAHYHYEDGVLVMGCSKGMSSDGNGATSSDYYTDPGSRNFAPGSSKGSSSYTGANGQPVVIYTYRLDENNNAIITGYAGGGFALSIPSSIDGYTVTAIDGNAFKGNGFLHSVKLPNTITEIGAYAFKDCRYLTVVTLPNDLKTLGCGAFQGCISLTSVNIPKDMNTGMYCGNGMYPGPFAGCHSLNDIVFEEGITYLPDALFSEVSGLKHIDLPDTITHLNWKVFQNCRNLETVNLPANLTHIASNVFLNCSALKEITLPKSMVELGCGAFQNCTSLEKVNIPKNMNTGAYCGNGMYPGPFAGCESLNSIEFAEGITYLPDGLFSDCNGLISIDLPDTITHLNWKVFQNCRNLETANLPANLTHIASNAFLNCSALTEITLPKSMVELGCGAFENCSSLEKVNIPKNMNTGAYCGNPYYPGPFTGCSSLNNVVFEEGITRIPDGLFLNCTGLKELVIPDTVTHLKWVAFKQCSGLISVQLPEGLTNIAGNCFSDCTRLKEIQIPDSAVNMGNYAFSGCSSLETAKLPELWTNIVEGLFENCTSLKEVNLPGALTAIRKKAFFNCDQLASLTIEDTITVIEADAFNNCDGLTNISIGNGVTFIGNAAFHDCDALTTVTMGNNVTSMGSSIFAHCDALTDVTLSRNLESISNGAFQECGALSEIEIPYYVTSIGANAFNASPKLVKVTMPRGLTSVAGNAFSYPSTTVIYGVSGTYAETWAKDNGFTFVAQEVTATEIALNKNEITLNKGASETLVLSVIPTDSTDTISWKSSDTTVATVSDKGVVKAVGIGSTILKVTVGDLSATCQVTVVQPVTSINLNKTSLSLEALDTYQLTANVSPNQANNKAVTWSTSDTSVATVDETGLVTAVAKGTATITVTAADGSGVARTCNVTVTNTGYAVTDPTQMESSHTYPANHNDFWTYTVEDAAAIEITFDERTEIEDGFDYLYIYDGSGNQIGKYTGTELANQTVTVPGDTVKIQLVSDDAGTAWGFKVTKITEAKEEHVHAYGEWEQITAPSCTTKGEQVRRCACGATEQESLALLSHQWTATNCDTPKTCSVCGATEGKPAGHSYDDNVDGTCNNCGVNRENVETRQVTHMFRMYNPNTGEHFYTGSEEEKSNLVAVGWNYEGVGFTFPANTGDPVHRLFQPSTGEHLYTMDVEEKERLMDEGWNYEGIAFNSAYDTEAVQHRLHNPNATVGAYHFTFSEEEMNNLITVGWEYQGIGWYSCWK